ncbi:MAG: bifunctional UDP-N-acetylglucosamine diphosphorylase/glucosamine-1-phosphate N-acetyltransferase GlmU [Candidatus Omnitrophica bacterium CG11_big_fil_rev_8_21_14_0_20_41_12]|nr:MAG: bifunctional UDP-N-acetylglucosamine diphosphorylase/glucosamine-1-phosphate N-acetyltransferase GlmU [Candidatus Omnitrophica bacterium CG11_big_fil_rev_8_21_14_0_20_41_12]
MYSRVSLFRTSPPIYMKKDIVVIILAAGKSTRMKSALPKVLHKLCSRPMLGYVLDLVAGLKPKQVVAVLGNQQGLVRKVIPKGIKIVIQKKLIGTADAVKAGLSALKGFKGTVLVLYGDIPLLKKETLKKLIDYHFENNVDATLLTTTLKKPFGYGRIMRDKYSSVCGIVEEKDADEVQKDIKEINTGIIAFRKDRLAENLKYIRPNNRKKEYYLTDIIEILAKRDYLVDAVKVDDPQEALGINTRAELAKANSLMQKTINDKFMQNGVTIMDPASTFISFGTKIGADTVIYPFTVIESNVKIGKRCSVGPFAHLREGVELKDDVTAGNFIEMVRSRIGVKTFVKHFSYIADSSVGSNVNIGAGTVTANFDGIKKNHTIIENNVKIGSDTVIVAPAKIGKFAVTGAGSVITKNIPDRTVVVGVPARILTKKRKKNG